MTDRPIIFSGPMVRALLSGWKTQTRRIINLPTKGEYVRPDMGGWAATTVGGGSSFTVKRDGSRVPAPEQVAIWNQTTGTCIASRYQIGDRLWVRENIWQAVRYPGTSPSGEADETGRWSSRLVHYSADGHPPNTPNRHYPHGLSDMSGCYSAPDPYATWQQRPSIHMPRWASRLTLIVEGVKIERLQDISEQDAIAEGINAISMADVPRQAAWSARGDFAQLWNKLHGADAWGANPFVTPITFRVIKANIDAPEARVAA